jgi:NAD(P) transhydrogenase
MAQQHEYDLAVIGSGPAGQRAAIQAAKLGRRVVVIEKQNVVGGVCINTGTIPSKTLREAVLHLSGHRERGVYGAAYAVKRNITMADLHFRTGHVVRHEIDVIRHQLMRNRIDVVAGAARFHDAHTLFVARADGHGHEQVSAERIVVAVGTEATRNAGIPFDGQRVLISDDVLDLAEMPRSLTVIGAGVIGIEYATMFATLGVRVTLVDKRDRLLPFIDREITDNLAYHMQHNWITLRLGEEVRAVEPIDEGRGQRVRTTLASGKQIVTDKALYSIGRTGATGGLNLEAAGLCTDGRGRLAVNANFQTCQAHIYAVGDVIGFPSLASTSMEQGRLAACHAFGVAADSTPGLFPYGIYTIPEISTVGRNEEELTAAGVPYEIGKANYKEIARGQILGDSAGLLKLIFHRETRALLGVHIIGEGASELVHIGQAVLAHGGSIDYFVDNVFNYPTLAECYKTAAFDGINRLG